MIAVSSGSERDELSLEALEEREEERLAERDEDAEAALDQMIDELVTEEALREVEDPRELRRGEEFTCTSCHLILSRCCLADRERLVCVDCEREAERGREHAAREALRHRRTIEFTCPACAAPLLLPELDRGDTPCGFFCPACGVHLFRRAEHMHFAWDHRFHPMPARHPAGPTA